MNQPQLPQNLAARIVQAITAVEQPLKIILFGYYAYGNPSTDSDLDLLIIYQRQREITAQRSASISKSA